LGQHLIVHVGHLLGNAEEVALADVVLGVEPFVFLDVGVLEWVGLGEQVSC
jgi:hypothetical protein